MNTRLQPQTNVVSSRRRVQTHVVTLERVQQSHAVSPPAQQFHVSSVFTQQQHRFFSREQGLLPFYHLPADVQGMRGLLESCLDLPAPPTSTTTAPPAHPFNARHAQQQRLKRARGDHAVAHAAVAELSAAASGREKGKRRGRPSSAKSAAPAAPAGAAAGFGDQQTYFLQVLMNLWHLYTTHDGVKASTSTGYSLPLPQAPRMLTPEEERVLGSIIQQHRKLAQLCNEHPDTAAAVLGATSSSDAGASCSSSSSKPVKQNKRYRWPPPLSAADIAEVSALPAVWRSMLPTLAAQAEDLLVGFNTGLVVFMLRRARRLADVPQADLVTSGLSGLRLAATRFDPRKGTRFSTVASMWIAQHISRSSAAESGRAMRRPEHHLQMLRHVATHYGMDAVLDIQRRPDVAEKVAALFKTKPSAVVEAISETTRQHSPISLEAIATGASSKADDASTAWSNLLTTTDLDEDREALGTPGLAGSMSGGLGTLLAAAGQMPGWAQASIHLQQQQHAAAAAAPAAAGAAGEQEEDSVHARVAAAAAKLVQLAADGASPSAASATGSMMDTLDDTGSVLESSMQSVLQVLTPFEQQVISTLYSLDQDATAGLGVELPPADFGGASPGSSSGPGSGRRRSQPSSSSSSDEELRAATAGRNPKVLQAAKHGRGSVTLKQAAQLLGLGSHQLVANVRNQALGKLAAATRQSAAALRSGADDAGAAAAAVAAAAPRASSRGPRTLELIELLRQYVAEFGHLPQHYEERYEGVLLYSWVQRMRTRYWQGKVAPVLAAALQEAVPIWHWGEPPAPAAGAEAPAELSSQGAAAAGEDSCPDDRGYSSTKQVRQTKASGSSSSTKQGLKAQGSGSSSSSTKQGRRTKDSGSSSSTKQGHKARAKPAAAAAAGDAEGSEAAEVTALAVARPSKATRPGVAKRGRPPKAAAVAAGPSKRGRPPKAAAVALGPSKRGRPPKVAAVAAEQ